MKIYKVKVNGKSYRVELESIEQVASEAVTEAKKKKRKLPLQLLVEMATKSNHQSKVASSLLRLKLVM